MKASGTPTEVQHRQNSDRENKKSLCSGLWDGLANRQQAKTEPLHYCTGGVRGTGQHDRRTGVDEREHDRQITAIAYTPHAAAEPDPKSVPTTGASASHLTRLVVCMRAGDLRAATRAAPNTIKNATPSAQTVPITAIPVPTRGTTA